jgi:hypothetical protein
MVSLGTMLYLVARSLPRVGEEISDKPGFLDKLSSSELPEKIDAAFNNFLFKSLRKSKVIVMKVENFINGKLKKISPNGKDKPKIDFKDLTEDSSGIAREGKEEVSDSQNS